MIALVEARQARIGIAPLCAALGLARATFYRRRGGPPPGPVARPPRRPPVQATAATLITSLTRALTEGRLEDRLKVYTVPRLLIIDEIGYLTR